MADWREFLHTLLRLLHDLQVRVHKFYALSDPSNDGGGTTLR